MPLVAIMTASPRSAAAGVTLQQATPPPAAPRRVPRPRVPEVGQPNSRRERKAQFGRPRGRTQPAPCQRRLRLGLAPLTSRNPYLLWASAARMARRRHLRTAPCRGACRSWVTCRRTRHVRSRARKSRAQPSGDRVRSTVRLPEFHPFSTPQCGDRRSSHEAGPKVP